MVAFVAKGFDFGWEVEEVEVENGFLVEEAVEGDFLPKMLSPNSGGGLEGAGT